MRALFRKRGEVIVIDGKKVALGWKILKVKDILNVTIGKEDAIFQNQMVNISFSLMEKKVFYAMITNLMKEPFWVKEIVISMLNIILENLMHIKEPMF